MESFQSKEEREAQRFHDSAKRTDNESSIPLECVINGTFLHQLPFMSFEFTFSLSLSVCPCMSVCVHSCMCEHCNYLSLFNRLRSDTEGAGGVIAEK